MDKRLLFELTKAEFAKLQVIITFSITGIFFSNFTGGFLHEILDRACTFLLHKRNGFQSLRKNLTG